MSVPSRSKPFSTKEDQAIDRKKDSGGQRLLKIALEETVKCHTYEAHWNCSKN